MYEERFYRNFCDLDYGFQICYNESDLFIWSDKPLNKDFAYTILKKYYLQIEEHIKKNPLFLTSLTPLPFEQNAPAIINNMIKSAQHANVGPFASVAGAIAQYVGLELLGYTEQLIIENGGDIFLKINKDKKLGVYLGKHFDLTIDTIFLKIKKRQFPFGIASSSAFIGHSLNFGRADLVTVIAKDAISADCFATALSNRIKKINDIKKILDIAKNNPLIEAMLIAFEKKIYLWGDIEIL
ncbi:MAG: UPF0280 family protein [Candidatus Omnitrophica bacterium]|nr:UPF0280 family protein [Candidatus Omnitrophota bacterium]